MTHGQALIYLRNNHAVVRFYRDDETKAEMIRVVIEDDTEEHRTIVKQPVGDDAIKSFCQAVEQAKNEFEPMVRRLQFRAV